MKQIVNTYSVARTFETEDNSVENIKKEIGKYIDEMADHILGNPNNENFQIFELTIIINYIKIIKNPYQYIPLVIVLRSTLLI